MPLGRILLKSISDSKKLSILKTDGARLLYSWLIPHLDVNGCFSADPEVVKGHIFTRLNKKISDISAYLDDLNRVGLIVIYCANGDIFLQVPDFTEKQPQLHPEREAKPTIPLPEPEQIIPYSGLDHEQVLTSSHTIKVKLSKVKLNQSKEAPPDSFDEFWNSYPKKIGKKDAQRMWARIMKDGVSVAEILRAVKGYTIDLKKNETKEKYIKHPSTFLNEDRWRDYLNIEAPKKLGENVRSDPAGRESMKRAAALRAQYAAQGLPESEINERVAEEINKGVHADADGEVK
jgi:hypothetical protein